MLVYEWLQAAAAQQARSNLPRITLPPAQVLSCCRAAVRTALVFAVLAPLKCASCCFPAADALLVLPFCVCAHPATIMLDVLWTILPL